MKKHLNKILIFFTVAAVLAAAYFLAPDTSVDNVKKTDEYSYKSDSTDKNTDNISYSDAASDSSADNKSSDSDIKSADSSGNELIEAAKPNMNADEKLRLAAEIAASEKQNGGTNASGVSGVQQPVTPDESIDQTQKNAAESSNENIIPNEPNTALTCKLSVKCSTILNNMNLLDPEKRELIPSDGVIFSEKNVEFNEGETVFNVLLREMKKNKIHLEFVKTPVFNSAYIEGIANIYELDCGELSGWMYSVNGSFPNYGCSKYTLKNNDKIEWVYTCNLGIDVGGYNASLNGGQKDE